MIVEICDGLALSLKTELINNKNPCPHPYNPPLPASTSISPHNYKEKYNGECLFLKKGPSPLLNPPILQPKENHL